MLIVTTSAKYLVTLVPCRLFVWVVAQLAEHRTVTAARDVQLPSTPPQTFSICDFRLLIDGRDNRRCRGCSLVGSKRCTVDAEIASSNLASPAISYRLLSTRSPVPTF